MAVQPDLSYRRSVWASSLITLAGLALFVGIAALIPRPGSRVGILILSIFLALVPAVVWLVFFAQQDRAEPEPKRLVARMFAFGALAAAAVAIPLADVMINQTISQFPSLVMRLILTTLSISLMQEVLKVAMVRYVVLGTNEFDRHPDGIVYGLASGLGFATVLNVAYVLQSGGVLPLAGAIRAVDAALIHGALGAVSGYYIGRVKIDGKKVGWLAQGLAVVTVVNGIYQVASEELSRRLVFNPWYSLIVSVALAVIVGVVLFAFFRRALRRASGDLSTISIQAHARSKDMPWDIKVRYDWLLIGALLLALAVGLGAGVIMASRTIPYTGEEMTLDFRYPAGWAVESSDPGNLVLRDLNVQGVFKPIISMTDEKVRAGATLDLLVADWVASRERQDTLYTEIVRQTDLTVGGYPAVRTEYQYATATSAGPAVVMGIETYVLVGTRLYTFRYESEPAAFDTHLARYERLLRSVRFRDVQ